VIVVFALLLLLACGLAGTVQIFMDLDDRDSD
jgi:hypothetical protein